MRWGLTVTTALLAAGSVLLAARAETAPSFEEAAAIARAATVTVRVTTADDPAATGERNTQVTVCSGVSLGQGLIAAPLFHADDATVRVTLPGGDQLQARPKVLDEYSGLVLLSVERKDLPQLPPAEKLPKVGSWVISAAAWGVENPVVSFGILSGVGRRLPGTSYPPLLQCNLTAVETSSGAPVVTPDGQLIGIIVAAAAPEVSRGWTFAVPVHHLTRLLRVYHERFAEHPDRQRVVILKRRRPVVGMEIGGQLDQVVVRRVFKNGPAERAGIHVGDRILAVDGVKIRSVYQAIHPMLFKQPGDTVTFLIQRDAEQQQIEVILGGGVALSASDSLRLSNLIEPKVVVDALALRRALRQQQETAEVGPGSQPPGGAASQQTLLGKAIERYQAVVEMQQEQLAEQQRQLDEANRRIEQLEQQLLQLKQRLSSSSAPFDR